MKLWSLSLIIHGYSSNQGPAYIPRILLYTLLLKVRLHRRREAAWLARDMLQRDLLRGNSVYMVGSCRARLLHIIHVSTVSEVSVLQEKCSRQPVPCGNFKFKMPPGLAAVECLLWAACCRVNAPVVFLCFYFVARLSRRSRAACRIPCKRSLKATSAGAWFNTKALSFMISLIL